MSRCSSGSRVELPQRTHIPGFMSFGNGSQQSVIMCPFGSCRRRQRCPPASTQSMLRPQIRAVPEFRILSRKRHQGGASTRYHLCVARASSFDRLRMRLFFLTVMVRLSNHEGGSRQQLSVTPDTRTMMPNRQPCVKLQAHSPVAPDIWQSSSAIRCCRCDPVWPCSDTTRPTSAIRRVAPLPLSWAARMKRFRRPFFAFGQAWQPRPPGLEGVMAGGADGTMNAAPPSYHARKVQSYGRNGADVRTPIRESGRVVPRSGAVPIERRP
jgi:hypothetical protein